MKFVSTRNSKLEVSGAQAVVKGLSEEGGLFVPAFFPEVSADELNSMRDMSYDERAAFIVGKYLPELAGDLNEYTKKAYARFDGDPAPLVMLEEDLGILELWHGPTHAFKDIALTLLPYLLTGSKNRSAERKNAYSRRDERRYGQSRARRVFGRCGHGHNRVLSGRRRQQTPETSDDDAKGR